MKQLLPIGGQDSKAEAVQSREDKALYRILRDFQNAHWPAEPKESGDCIDLITTLKRARELGKVEGRAKALAESLDSEYLWQNGKKYISVEAIAALQTKPREKT